MSDDLDVPAGGDAWNALRSLTPARVALGRTGASLPTQEVLRFGHAHALARDAVHAVLDRSLVEAAIARLGHTSVAVNSAAGDRATYLRRPDLGRRLGAGETERLVAMTDAHGCDLAVVVADGLSATAIHTQVEPLLAALLPQVVRRGLRLAPLTIATQARVALGDAVGGALEARLALVLIGERPGLSSPDSLGAYLTYEPRPGRRDNERNCISNIRAAGLSPARAAEAILWLMGEALRRGETGVALKDESRDIEVLPPGGVRALP
ncbi:ethanolamine ammonia-lyase subunit EutC [Lichenihabitans sp. Uapishka_5]|uniref:ethanolamine ammonia-lyase subunit EutC n=1 Tax=Lichenihabitans sp. Uapishka_5 TaxID=3037302 RepID=UPI0029E813DB|nr:ethanolamine ammonia-lyase subunit EutC [Lichenihabitans sp. Uapishka_5]MDX7950961.1 ethanolamine ammonia-lyase subunit EutC [Lichenihabitans sp. Uapishka_5]